MVTASSKPRGILLDSSVDSLSWNQLEITSDFWHIVLSDSKKCISAVRSTQITHKTPTSFTNGVLFVQSFGNICFLFNSHLIVLFKDIHLISLCLIFTASYVDMWGSPERQEGISDDPFSSDLNCSRSPVFITLEQTLIFVVFDKKKCVSGIKAPDKIIIKN